MTPLTPTEKRLVRGVELGAVLVLWAIVFRLDEGADLEILMMILAALFGVSISQVSRPIIFRLGWSDVLKFTGSRGFYAAGTVILFRWGSGLPLFPGTEAILAWAWQFPVLALVIWVIPRTLQGEVGIGATAPPKRIAIWSVNYAPEEAGIAPQTTALAQSLKEAGYLVTVVTTFPYYPEWRKRNADLGKFHEWQVLEGITVHRCWHYVPPNPTTLQRIVHQLSFLMTSLYRLLLLERHDLYIGICPPFALGPLMRVVGLVKLAPYFLHVQDLEVQAAADLRQIPSEMVRFFRWFERWGYWRAAKVTTISHGMIKTLATLIPNLPVGLLPNRPRRFPHLLFPYNTAQMGETSSRSVRRVLYTGNIGEKQDLITAAAAFREVPNVELHIHGEGSAKGRLMEWLQANPCSNVTVGPLIPAEAYARTLDAADACLICEKPGPENISYFPSKLLVYLDLGRPVLLLAGTESELYQLNREHRFALGCEPGENPTDLIRRFSHLPPQELDSWAKAAKHFLPTLRGDTEWNRYFEDCRNCATYGTSESIGMSLRFRLFLLRTILIPIGLVVLVAMHLGVRLFEKAQHPNH